MCQINKNELALYILTVGKEETLDSGRHQVVRKINLGQFLFYTNANMRFNPHLQILIAYFSLYTGGSAPFLFYLATAAIIYLK